MPMSRLCGGTLFSFAYLLVASLKARGDMRLLLLGDQVAAER